MKEPSHIDQIVDQFTKQAVPFSSIPPRSHEAAIQRMMEMDNSFSVVVTRYSVHHFVEPRRVLREMKRVCRPGGTVLVVDMVLPAEKRAAYDQMEKLRDPSHLKTPTVEELLKLVQEAQLKVIETDFYRWEMGLEVLLKASFPQAGAEAKVREMFWSDLGQDNLGVGAHQAGKDIHFAYPVAILSGKK